MSLPIRSFPGAALVALLFVVVACCVLTLPLLFSDDVLPAVQEAPEDDADGDSDEDMDDDEDSDEGSDAESGGWNLEVLEEEFHPLARAIEARDYEEAVKLAKEVGRQASKAGWDKVQKRKLKFLKTLAGELRAAEKIAYKRRNNVKDLQKLVHLTRKNRDTFAYSRFQELEDKVRARVGIAVINHFDPPAEAWRMNQPFDFFSPVKWRSIVTPTNPWVTTDPDKVYQGRYALAYKDTQEKKNWVYQLPIPFQDDWREFRYLYVTACIEKPKDGALEIYVYKPSNEYFILNLASWKGWKTHRVDFKRTGRRYDTRRQFDWGPMTRLQFSLEGAVSDFYVDDIYLSR